MKIKFMGTGGSESIPALFCNCVVCQRAREIGGKERRTRTGIMINDDLMIDFSPDVNVNSQKYEVNLHKLKYLLITHSHADHFNIEDLCLRNEYNLGKEESEKLEIYANNAVINTCEHFFNKYNCRETIKATAVIEKIPIFVGDYKITPLRSRHINNFNENSLVYLIQQNGKSYLHLVDSGEIFPDVYEYLKANKIIVDMIAIDTTFSLCKERYFGHLNLEQVLEICEKLKEIGVIISSTKVYLTHIAHFATHEAIEKACEGKGVVPAYDGLEVNI